MTEIDISKQVSDMAIEHNDDLLKIFQKEGLSLDIFDVFRKMFRSLTEMVTI